MPSLYEFTDYSPEWPIEFEREANRLRAILGDELVQVHHIGSTSVPDLAAKAVIDLLPLVRTLAGIDSRATKLEEAGYQAWGEFGLPGRRFFTRDRDGYRRYNLHFYQAGDPDVERHLAFAEYLRHHPKIRDEYEALKHRLFELHRTDIKAYSQAKDAWVKQTEHLAVHWFRERQPSCAQSISGSDPSRGAISVQALLPLHSPRLVLRCLSNADLDPFLAYRNDPDVARFQGWEQFSAEEARSFLHSQVNQDVLQPGKWFQIAIALTEANQLIGDCALKFDACDTRLATLGITLSRDHWGQGFATEALTTLLDGVFRKTLLHRVVADTDPRNAAARSLLERLGMRQEAHLRQSLWFKGSWADELLFAVLREEWFRDRQQRVAAAGNPK